MNILGICGGHDANWCLWKDGALVAAFEKERYSRIKRDGGICTSYIAQSIMKFGTSLDDIDFIATSEPVHRGLEPGLQVVSGERYTEPHIPVEQVLRLEGKEYPAISVPHHLAHAAYAYFTSPFDRSAVITWDGGGDAFTENAYCATSLSTWRDGALCSFSPLHNSEIGSLWYMYSRLIFGDGDAAGKLMGLSAYGDYLLYDDFKDRFCAPALEPLSGAHTIKNTWPDLFSPPFSKGVHGWDSPAAMRIAKAVQALTEECGESLAKSFLAKTGERQLCVAGGVALNGYLNKRLLSLVAPENLHVPPAVHDGGLSVGASLYAAHVFHGISVRRHRRNLAFLGEEFSQEEIIKAIKLSGLSATDVSARIANEIATDLRDGKVIALTIGRSEHGPRALGNRSILALPSKTGIKNRLNSEIKKRELFRPFAPVIRRSDACAFCESVTSSPYMMYIDKMSNNFQRQANEAVHVDGTARVQTVEPEELLHKIIDELEIMGEFPSLLNTSFNVSEPIVNTPMEALKTFSSSAIDALYISCFKVEK